MRLGANVSIDNNYATLVTAKILEKIGAVLTKSEFVAEVV
jgi:hypothetical protein